MRVWLPGTSFVAVIPLSGSGDLARGDVRRAAEAHERTLARRPDDAAALEGLGRAYVRLGRLADARALLDRLEPLDRGGAARLRAAIDGATG